MRLPEVEARGAVKGTDPADTGPGDLLQVGDPSTETYPQVRDARNPHAETDYRSASAAPPGDLSQVRGPQGFQVSRLETPTTEGRQTAVISIKGGP